MQKSPAGKQKIIPRHLTELIDAALRRKEKFLSENARYRRFEAMMHSRTAGKYIGDVVYGANDGIITTFAVIAGSAGASLSHSVIIILGFANLVADGISMGASNYLGGKSEKDYVTTEEMYEEEIGHFLHAIEKRYPYPFTFEENLRYLKVLFALEKSAKTQRYTSLQ
jgi:hypothetical protein